MNKSYYVYILASDKKGTLYIGVTNDLVRRIYEHKNNLASSFSSKYDIHSLVYYETTSDINSALLREKQMKKWKRQWKINLIEKMNPEWDDLYEKLVQWIPACAGMTVDDRYYLGSATTNNRLSVVPGGQQVWRTN